MLKIVSVRLLMVLIMVAALTVSDATAQTRIRFGRGRTSTAVSGRLASGASRSYILGASAGQMMRVRVTSRTGGVRVDIGGNDVGTGTSIRLRSTDDYIITVHNDGAATNYTLSVSIR